MTIDELVNSDLPEWLVNCADSQDIVIGTIGRLVRNLNGFRFPGWSTPEDRRAVSDILLPALRSLRGFKDSLCAEMSELSYEQRRALLVRKQLTPCMAARQDGCHILLPQHRNIVCMVNEEEHLVLHVCRAGNSVREVLAELRKLADNLEKKVTFAHTTGNGYLTSMPGESGDGIQIYTILHLPALTISNMMPQVCKAMEKLHVNISPYYSDGEDDTGNQFIAYSIPGPEGSTDEMLTHYRAVLKNLINREQQVRFKLALEPGLILEDKVARAFATLSHARRLSLQESRNALSILRLGRVLGMIDWDDDGQPKFALSQLRHLDCVLALYTALNTEEQEVTAPVARAGAIRMQLDTHHAQLSDNVF